MHEASRNTFSWDAYLLSRGYGRGFLKSKNHKWLIITNLWFYRVPGMEREVIPGQGAGYCGVGCAGERGDF